MFMNSQVYPLNFCFEFLIQFNTELLCTYSENSLQTLHMYITLCICNATEFRTSETGGNDEDDFLLFLDVNMTKCEH